MNLHTPTTPPTPASATTTAPPPPLPPATTTRISYLTPIVSMIYSNCKLRVTTMFVVIDLTLFIILVIIAAITKFALRMEDIITNYYSLKVREAWGRIPSLL